MDSRQEFENEAKKQGFCKHFKPYVDGSINYQNNLTQASWKAWQACQSLNDKKIAQQQEIIDQQMDYLKGLNMCIGGEDSATTDNLTKCARYLDEEQCLFEVISDLEAKLKVASEALQYADKMGFFNDAFVNDLIFSKRQAVKKLNEALKQLTE